MIKPIDSTNSTRRKFETNNYKSEQSTQTVRIPTAFTHRTRAMTSTHLRTRLANIEAQQERERHRRHRQEFQRIHRLFNNLAINIEEQQ